MGRQESQCVSSQAFSLRLAGFITATNHWPDKSSYFILPSFASALLFLFSSLFSLAFYFPKTSLPLFPPDSAAALHASPCTPPGMRSVFPHTVTALFSISSVFFSSLSFHLLYYSAHTYTALFFFTFLHSTFCSSSTPPPPPSL